MMRRNEVATITKEVATITKEVATITNALCSYPHVNVSIRDFSQILTTAPIFLYSNYFRQKYLEIASCAVSLLNNIWVRVEHSLLQQPNLKENQLQFKQFAGMM